MAATITSITGLQNLTNLQNFYADWNSLTTVNLSGMTSLVNVDVSDNNTPDDDAFDSLTSINLTGCTNIQNLYLDDSNFSEEGISSVAGLSDLTSCGYIDLRRSEIAGTVDLSTLSNLTSLIISDNNVENLILSDALAPIDYIQASDNALILSSVNDILIKLDEGGALNGEVVLQGGTNSGPSGLGVDAAVNLDGKGWTISTNINPDFTQYNNWYDLTDSGSVCAGTATFNTFYASGSLGIGTEAYAYNWGGIPTADGWYKSNEGLSNTLYFITGGMITSTGSCPI
jgi:hypothetical protein